MKAIDEIIIYSIELFVIKLHLHIELNKDGQLCHLSVVFTFTYRSEGFCTRVLTKRYTVVGCAAFDRVLIS